MPQFYQYVVILPTKLHFQAWQFVLLYQKYLVHSIIGGHNHIYFNHNTSSTFSN